MTWSATGDQQDRTKELEKTAREILTVYERLGRGTGLGVSGSSGSNTGGKDRDACVKLLKILEASERGRDGHVERALEIIESTALVPLDVATTSGKESEVDVMKVTKKAEEFTLQHEALQRCLPVYLVLCMDALSGVASKIKSGLCPPFGIPTYINMLHLFVQVEEFMLGKHKDMRRLQSCERKVVH